MIAKTARLIETKDPAFQNTFVIDDGSMTYEEAINYAVSFCRDAPANQERFDKYALRETFFTALTAKVADFREVAQDQADGKRTGGGANAEQESRAQSRTRYAQGIRPRNENHFRNDPQKLSEWQTASHIRKPDEPNTGEIPPPEQVINKNG